MKTRYVGLLLVLVLAVALTGCSELMPAAEPTPAAPGGGWGYDSAYLTMSYEGALPVTSQLMLGTMELEGTEHAVTPAQAKTLLPLWQAFQGNTLRDNAERSAVLAQIEKTMTPAQMEAIAAMQLTFSDMQTWAESQGISMSPPGGGQGGPSSDARATMQARFGNMTEAEREAMRATAQAGGGLPGGGQGGGQGGEGRRMGGAGMMGPMLEPLIELLTQRAAE